MPGLTNRIDSINLIKMFKNIPIPPSFSLIKKRKTFLLLKDEYRNFLLQQGIEDLEIFLKKHVQTTRYLTGRSPHPSIPIKDGERMIVRGYSHGGLFSLFTRNLYLFGSRSFRELALTEEIRSSGIPTIEPVGAIHRLSRFPFYQPYLLSLEIPHALNLIQYFQETGPHPSFKDLPQKRKMIRSAGLLLRQFHEMGFFHGDLQLKNILIAGEQLRFIDFDHSYRKPLLSLREKMKNLLRLNRSVEKWRRLGLPMTRTDQWRFFLSYAGEDVKMRKAMQKVVRTYSVRHLFYRFGWAVEKIVRSV
jgi:tRNA A-37 threonylcarbamoyl transferase component Bud32